MVVEKHGGVDIKTITWRWGVLGGRRNLYGRWRQTEKKLQTKSSNVFLEECVRKEEEKKKKVNK